ncbi:MAG: hypothetical protein QNK05_08025 [Myxococcota bacterium]|nr:hypothetical protein [Myxococcota bacterium]
MGSTPSQAAVGVDVGATLAKIAVRQADGREERLILPASEPSAVCGAVAGAKPERIGLTGAGATALAPALLDLPGAAEPVRVMEFAAWGAGARELLREQGHVDDPHYLLVSLGTGTSVMHADGISINRVGGTALGGGTVLGLGSLLLGTRDFAEITALAAEGDRRSVDLFVSDIYRAGEIPLTGDITAANFGRVGRPGGPKPEELEKRDLAQAIMTLVGQNVALICATLASSQGIRRVVFGGSTLLENPALAGALEQVSTMVGLETIFLESGEFAGAVGALHLAAPTTPKRALV